MAAIRECEFVAIDFESAGTIKGGTDVPVQVGWAVWKPGEDRIRDTFRSYLASDRPITWAARDTHGISDADLEGAPVFGTLWPQVRVALEGRVVVAHGAGTEKRFLRAFPMHRFGPWVDTVRLSRAAAPGLGGYSLEEVGAHFGVVGEVRGYCGGLDWHDALFDAVASLAVVRKLVLGRGLEDEPIDLLVAPDTGAYYARLYT